MGFLLVRTLTWPLNDGRRWAYQTLFPLVVSGTLLMRAPGVGPAPFRDSGNILVLLLRHSLSAAENR